MDNTGKGNVFPFLSHVFPDGENTISHQQIIHLAVSFSYCLLCKFTSGDGGGLRSPIFHQSVQGTHLHNVMIGTAPVNNDTHRVRIVFTTRE